MTWRRGRRRYARLAEETLGERADPAGADAALRRALAGPPLHLLHRARALLARGRLALLRGAGGDANTLLNAAAQAAAEAAAAATEAAEAEGAVAEGHEGTEGTGGDAAEAAALRAAALTGMGEAALALGDAAGAAEWAREAQRADAGAQDAAVLLAAALARAGDLGAACRSVRAFLHAPARGGAPAPTRETRRAHIALAALLAAEAREAREARGGARRVVAGVAVAGGRGPASAAGCRRPEAA